jgi:hypothetical protein
MTTIEVVDSAVKIGLGALIGGLFTYWLERLKQKGDLAKARRERFNSIVVSPIISFLNDLHECISETYWSSIDPTDSSAANKIIALRNQEAMVEARIAALNDKNISAKFRELTTKRLEIGTLLSQKKISEARNKMDDVFRLSGEILRKILKEEYNGGCLERYWGRN